MPLGKLVQGIQIRKRLSPDKIGGLRLQIEVDLVLDVMNMTKLVKQSNDLDQIHVLKLDILDRPANDDHRPQAPLRVVERRREATPSSHCIVLAIGAQNV